MRSDARWFNSYHSSMDEQIRDLRQERYLSFLLSLGFGLDSFHQ